MSINKLLGFMLGMAGTFLMWQAGVTLAYYAQLNGWTDFNELIFNPIYSLKVLAAMGAFIAGLAALTEHTGGKWLAGMASCIMAVTVIAYLGGHGHVHAWKSEAILLLMMTGLFLATIVRGRPAAQASEPAHT